MANRGEQPHIEIQPRDVQVLSTLADSRVATLAQLATFHFDGRREAAKKRLQSLAAAGFVARRPLPHLRFAAFVLARRGADVLRAGSDLSAELRTARQPSLSPVTIRHDLDVAGIRGAFFASLTRRSDLHLVSLSTRPEQIAFDCHHATGAATRVKPDGYVHWRERQANRSHRDHRCFLEVDRSTENLRMLIDRADRYCAHYRSGGFAVQVGAPAADFKRYPFRVLVVCRTAERRNNLAELLARGNSPCPSQVWLTTIDECERDPLGPIWVTSKDYTLAVSGTPYESASQFGVGAYRSSPERERRVEERITKRPLAG